MDWTNQVFEAGSKFEDQSGHVMILHKVGNLTMQLTNIGNGDTYVQFNTTDGCTLKIERDVPSEGVIRERLLALYPISNEQIRQREIDREQQLEKEREEAQDEIRMEREREEVQNEIRIFMRDFVGSIMFNIKEPIVNGQPVEQSEIVKDFSSLISSLLKVFVEAYNEIKDRKEFFSLVLNGLEHLHEQILTVLYSPEDLFPNITAKFFFEKDGKILLLINDEKEAVLKYQGQLQSNDTVLTPRAMKYIIIPNLRDVLGS